MPILLPIISLLLILTACSDKPHVIEALKSDDSGGKNIISIVNHGWHTGFVIPSNDIVKKLPQLKDRFGDKPYLEFGWGDKGFYQAKEITTGLIIKAILWPTDSVMHVVAVPELAEAYFPHSEVIEICLTKRSYNRLLEFIRRSFELDELNKITPLQKGIYGDSQFYKGAGKYYFMNTCNKWTAKGLKSAGMDVYPGFKLTAESVMEFVEENVGEDSFINLSKLKCF